MCCLSVSRSVSGPQSSMRDLRVWRVCCLWEMDYGDGFVDQFVVCLMQVILLRLFCHRIKIVYDSCVFGLLVFFFRGGDSLVCSFSLPEFGVISVRFMFSESKRVHAAD